ncbi:uncharacterized CRM domain-containing protein At3g25440, chloroplastic isoform X2 [Punica granatum]|uniref:Uncharacterized CRM domain-containing protein At3g25440, chloroplastic isoform X2 n=1 Tax=Punica granatum TaxID=22663 RepID=A0A6P8BUJ0_PUNGR|nr:uncharacterized CRM domain-containing protein At3g25440, chloroplastic isoform X2 [Punica granatum]
MAGKRVASSSLSAAMAAFRISSSSLKNCPAGRLLQAPLLAPRQPDRCVHPLYGGRRSPSVGQAWVRSCPYSNEALEQPKHLERSTAVGDGETKVKRKKLKGKRAVVRWLKFFRWKKKKEYERMTAEEKNLYKLRKARKKEERLVESLKKIEPKESSEIIHDPEILTPEEHFFFLKMAHKCKNYVPIGRRGIYQGVILNMHLHWKKHQTVKVEVKTFSPDEVKGIAAELARLTGGIVLDIHEENTIIMYRGKNYCQPPTEIMSPRVTLSRKKALDKSKYRDGLRAVRKQIPRLEQELELLRAQAERPAENKTELVEDTKVADDDKNAHLGVSSLQMENSSRLKEIIERAEDCVDDESNTELGIESDSEDLSDIFETDSETEPEDKAGDNLYLDAVDKFPAHSGEEPEDFEDHLRQISMDSRNARTEKHLSTPNLDEVDRMFLRAASLLKKKRR